MTTPQDPADIHRAALDAEGNRIGKISKMFLDEHTGQPEWVPVETGLFGARHNFAPIRGSKLDGELVMLAVSKDQVKDAPNVESGEQFSDSEQEALRRYYPGHPGTAGETRGSSRQAARAISLYLFAALPPVTSTLPTAPIHRPCRGVHSLS